MTKFSNYSSSDPSWQILVQLPKPIRNSAMQSMYTIRNKCLGQRPKSEDIMVLFVSKGINLNVRPSKTDLLPCLSITSVIVLQQIDPLLLCNRDIRTRF